MHNPSIYRCQFTVRGEAAMSACAAALAAQLQGNETILLSGTLGTGKTTFARGLIRALCGEQTEVVSPSFMLVQDYDAPQFLVQHYDLYRIEQPEELHELGLDEALGNALVLVEWPEIASGYWPAERIEISISHDDADNACRQLQVVAHGSMVATAQTFCETFSL